VVALDTAPTGHALRLFAMPDAALEWVHALLAILLKYRTVVGLGELASDLLDVARDLRALTALLRDPARTRVVAVTRPAALPRLETARLLRGLRRLRIAVGAVMINAVTPDSAARHCPRCRRAAAGERREITALAAAVRSAAGRRYAMISAPVEAPPPGGPARPRVGGRVRHRPRGRGGVRRARGNHRPAQAAHALQRRRARHRPHPPAAADDRPRARPRRRPPGVGRARTPRRGRGAAPSRRARAAGDGRRQLGYALSRAEEGAAAGRAGGARARARGRRRGLRGAGQGRRRRAPPAARLRRGRRAAAAGRRLSADAVARRALQEGRARRRDAAGPSGLR